MASCGIPITLAGSSTGIVTPVTTVATNSPKAIAVVTRNAKPRRLMPRVTWFLIMSWTPLISGTPGTMIMPGATRQREGVPLAPSSTAPPPMMPLRDAAANGMTIGLKRRRPSSWRSHVPAAPANHVTAKVGQSAAEQAAEAGCGQAERDDDEPPPVFRRPMLDGVQLGPRLCQSTPPALGVVDEAVDRCDNGHADIHR